jgi:hypothetical protein
VTLTLVLIGLVRIRLLALPLERDEGEYAYIGQLMLEGVAPYQLAYSMKLPGTCGVYALILALFGQTHVAVHWGLLLINAATIVLVYLLGARLFGSLAGVVAGASYGLLSVSASVLGFAGHATHFVLLPALGGLFLLLTSIEYGRSWRYLASGTLLGLAVVMKQHGIVFVLFGGLYLVWSAWRRGDTDWRRLTARAGAFTVGAILPFGLTCLALYAFGVFDKFWFWTFEYAREYATSATFNGGLRAFLRETPEAIGPSLAIWLVAGAGLVTLARDRARRRAAGFTLGLLIFSFLGVSLGFAFRPHYFVLALPAVALLAGLGVSSAVAVVKHSENWHSWTAVPLLVFAVASGWVVVQQREFLFQMDARSASRAIYGENPFPETVDIAKYIREHSEPTARIVVLGSEPQLYFYSRRRSATGYIYMYGLMEQQPYALHMQKDMIAEIEEARPDYLVSVSIPASWLPTRNSERFVLRWAGRYVEDHYDLEGIVDIVSMNRTEYRWGADARGYEPRSQYKIQVFKRRAG